MAAEPGALRSDPATARVAVIGIGNAWRGDDGVGVHVARLVARRPPAGVTVIESRGDAAGLIESWDRLDRVVVVDAARSGAPPGTIHRFDPAVGPLPALATHRSSHDLGLHDAIEIARALNRLPRILVVYGVEGDDYGEGSHLSPPVEAAAATLADRILSELER